MSIEQAIYKAYKIKKDRGWDYIYFAVDLHDTIAESTYTKDELDDKNFYNGALEVLQYISENHPEIVLILYTSSYKEYLESYMKIFKKWNINFKYFNENPECPTTELADFSTKFYFNVLIDDKAGFDPYEDWIKILDTLDEMDNKYFL